MAPQSIYDRVTSRSRTAGDSEGSLSAPPAKTGSRVLQRVAIYGGLGAVLITAAALGLHFYPGVGAFFAEEATAQSQERQAREPTKGETPFQQHIAQAGIKSCAKLFPVLGQALTSGSTYAVSTQWNNSSPNTHSVEALAGMSYDAQNYKGQAAGVVFASPVGEGCEGALVRVAPFQQPCDQVAASLPQGSTPAEALSGTPRYQLANNAGQALLVPSGDACVVITVAGMAG